MLLSEFVRHLFLFVAGLRSPAQPRDMEAQFVSSVGHADRNAERWMALSCMSFGVRIANAELGTEPRETR